MVRRRKLLDPETLNQFTFTKQWHEFSILNPNALLSDGALFVAEEGDTFWFFDIVALVQTFNEEFNQEIYQHWNVKYGEYSAVTIKCEDGINNIVYSQVKPFTNFPLRSFDLYAVNDDDTIKIMLPGEYKQPEGVRVVLSNSDKLFTKE